MSAAFDENTFIEKLNAVLVKTHNVKNSDTGGVSKMKVNSIEIPDFSQITNFFNEKQIGNDYEIQKFRDANETEHQFAFMYDFSQENIEKSLFDYKSFSMTGEYVNETIKIYKIMPYLGVVPDNKLMSGGAGKKIFLQVGIKIPKKTKKGRIKRKP